MKYRIKERGGLFYPQARSNFFMPWLELRRWNGVCNDYYFGTMEEARGVINFHEGERQRMEMIRNNIVYHPYL